MCEFVERWRGCGTWAVFLAAGVGRAAAPLPSSEFPSSPADERLTIFTRQALHQDESLAPFNLGVSVHAQVVTLWGTIPSASLSRLAEERAGQVPGVLGVHNELRVEVSRKADPVIATRPPVSSAPAPAPNPPPTPPSALVSRPGENPPPVRGPVSSPVQVTLRPPLAVEPVSALPPAPAPTARPIDLAGAVDRLRMADERFRQVRVETTDGIVRLRGVVPRWEDMYELAQSVSRLPGVERVVLEDVRTLQKRPLALP